MYYSVGAQIKLKLYRSLVLSIRLCGILRIQLSKMSETILEKLQKRAVKRTCGPGKYGQQLRLLYILPLPMHIQILNQFSLSNFSTSNKTTISLSQRQFCPQRPKNLQASQDQVPERIRAQSLPFGKQSKPTRKFRGNLWTKKD